MVPVGMLNITDDLCIIRKDTHLAQTSSVCSVHSMQNAKVSKTKYFKEQLEDLIGRCSDELSTQQL
jgi:hypothetical protein